MSTHPLAVIAGIFAIFASFLAGALHARWTGPLAAVSGVLLLLALRLAAA